MRSHNLELDMLLRGIIMSRGDDGATIAEMRADYFDIKLEPWPLQYQSTDNIRKYLLQIDGLLMQQQDSGLCVWYIDDLGNVSQQLLDSNNNVATVSDVTSITIDSRDGDHRFVNGPRAKSNPSSLSMESGVQLLSSTTEPLGDGRAPPKAKRTFAMQSPALVGPSASKRAKVSQPHRVPLSQLNVDLHDMCTSTEPRPKKTTSTELELGVQNTSNGSISLQNSLTEIDSQEFNREFEKQCRIVPLTKSPQSFQTSLSIDELSTFFKVRILGDDFMRSLISFAMFDGGAGYTDQRAMFCESGQTIEKVYRNIVDSHYLFTANPTKHMLINLGAMDILLNRNLIDIQAEYTRLIDALCKIGIVPIITTLPPIKVSPENENRKQIKQMVLLFNSFLVDRFTGCYQFIDLWKSFHSHSNLNDLYQVEPKEIRVGASRMRIWPWNKLGRHRVIRTVSNYLSTM